MNLGLKGKRVAILATNGVEESELIEPRKALEAAGAITEVISPEEGSIEASRHREKGASIPVDRALADSAPADYVALLLPGGSRNAATLSEDDRAVQFVRQFVAADKPVAAICHGPQLLVQADAVAGRTLTSSPKIRDQIEAAGGLWVDEQVHVDDRLITSRRPEDLPAFNSRIVTGFAESIDERRLDEVSEQSFPASDPPSMP